MAELFDEALNAPLQFDLGDLPPIAVGSQLNGMAGTDFAAADRWASDAAYAAGSEIEDARQMPAVILGTTIAAALHYSASLQADGMADLADAIREAGQRIAEGLKGGSDGGEWLFPQRRRCCPGAFRPDGRLAGAGRRKEPGPGIPAAESEASRHEAG
ncbi:MAG: hypothetical protein Q8O25_16085 [Sulfurisoma sp.]|nr:hypothetical protein [Sulfurisoma sp.]